VIVQVTAPSFLLGAVAGFVSLLMSRMNRVIDRIQALNALPDADGANTGPKKDIPRLNRRAVLLNQAVQFSAISAILTCLLVILAFICAYYQLRHEYGVAVLFVAALAFFTAALTNLVRETRISVHEYEAIRTLPADAGNIG
jgi:lipopolysaccharide export LptBFGC system permease protein LptF